MSDYGVRVEGSQVIIPLLGRSGAWYERTHRPGGNPKYLSPKGAEAHLYNPLGVGPGSSEVWLAEGEFDTLALVAVGAPAVGILGKEAFRSEWALLFKQARVVIAIDPDAEARAVQLAALFDPALVSRFDTTPHKDVNDWFKADRASFERAVLEWEN